MSHSSIAVSLRSASVAYRAEAGKVRQVWSNISIDIRHGEWIVVVGRNGSGKSTLASVLLGLCPLSGGQLVREDKGRMFAKGVLQNPEAQFVGDTVEEEMQHISAYEGLSAEARTRLYAEALNRVGLFIPASRLLSSLSGGQKQLVNIAAALAAQPDLIVLDELTAMLDPAARQDVLEAVRQAHRQGTTIVWITHRMEEVAEAGRVVAFGDGRIVYDGTPRDFFYKKEPAAPCDMLGLDPPFAVKTAQLLMEQGIELDPLPLRAEELAEAVSTR